MLIRTESALEVFKISIQIIIVLSILTLVFFTFAVTLAIKAQKRKTQTGLEGMIGEIGETLSDLNPEGQIRIHGEIWNAVSYDNQIIEKNSKVQVLEVHNLKLIVKKI
jgi:membrane-bound serine protease (ClpP class)